jgi:RES domain-containing protein
MVISIADNDSLIKQVPTRDLPKDWKLSTAYPDLQAIGSDWYTNKESLILKVPSAIITQEFNYIINTLHPDFSNNVQLVRTEDYFWDERLL